MNISNEFKKTIFEALLKKRENFGGSQAQFAKQHGINPQVFSELKRITANEKPNYDGKLRDNQWLKIGRELGVTKNADQWKFARTVVHEFIEEKMLFCKEYGCALMMVDAPEIGKTESAKYLAKTQKNTFYIDCSQCKGKTDFIKSLAAAVGVDTKGRLSDIKADTKYYIGLLDKPLIILDEMGDLSYNAFLDIKEYYNALVGQCGWFALGSDGLKNMVKRGIEMKKVGFREVYSRFGSRYINVVPQGDEKREEFYRVLLHSVLSVNISDSKTRQYIVNACIGNEEANKKKKPEEKEIAGIRRAKFLVNIIREEQMAKSA